MDGRGTWTKGGGGLAMPCVSMQNTHPVLVCSVAFFTIGCTEGNVNLVTEFQLVHSSLMRENSIQQGVL